MPVTFAENSKSPAPGKNKTEVTENNENKFDKDGVEITERQEAVSILSKARRDAVEAMVKADPRFNQDDELSDKIYAELEKISRYFLKMQKNKFHSAAVPNFLRRSKARLLAIQLSSDIKRQKYDILKRKLEKDSEEKVGEKRARPTEGGRRTRRKRRISRKCK